MGRFTRDELAQRAGVPVGEVDRLVQLGIIASGEDPAPFTDGDVRRVRFVHGLEQGGIPVEAVGSAVRGGDLSFAFFDWSYWDRLGGLSTATYREVSSATGVGLDMLQSIRESMGHARPGPDDHVREDEHDVISLAKTLLDLGADPGTLERHIRIWGESVRRIAEADANYYRAQVEAPLLEAGLSWSDMMQAGSVAAEAIGPMLDPALVALYHAQSEHTWLTNVVEAVEATLEQAGLHTAIRHPPAMCFLDLTGYTRLTEERGDEAAADMASTLGEIVHRSSNHHGGRTVKSLGDGVMLYFTDPPSAVRFALDMVHEVPAADLPPAHVGIDAGPVIFQQGDYFGRTVNIASRIAEQASASQVLVSEEVVLVTEDPELTFVEVGPVSLKGVSRPLRLHEARRMDRPA